ncbi:MAG: hypothetical protein HY903_10680 [Deltaproteobacteria bacterium]|nr:hypothetical protein [Deltaproteobacteria bacterium]
MTDLVTAIRERLRDKILSVTELNELMEIAAQGGITVDKVNSIVAACEQSTDGFNPVTRAHLMHRLAKLKATDALSAIRSKPVRTEGFHKLAERQAELELSAYDAFEAQRQLRDVGDWLWAQAEPSALGRGELRPNAGVDRAEFEAKRTKLQSLQAELLTTMAAVVGPIEAMSGAERAALYASASNTARSRWHDLQQAFERPEYLLGMSAADRATALSTVAKTDNAAPAGGSKSFADITFDEPVEWELDDWSLRLKLPKNTSITKIGDLGDFVIEGDALHLPGGATLSGQLRLVGGRVELREGCSYRSELVRLEATGSGVNVKTTKDTLVAGPGVKLTMSMVGAGGPTSLMGHEESPAELRTLKFALTDAELPDGTIVRQGKGELKVVFRDGKAEGVLKGSIKLDPESTVVKLVDDNPISLKGVSSRDGVVTRGGVVLKDGQPVGFSRYSDVSIDGLAFSTDSSRFTAYRFRPPATYEVGAGVSVTQAPAEREVTIVGDDLRIEREPRSNSVSVEKGGVKIKGDRVTALLPDTAVTLSWGKVEVDAGGATFLDAVPAVWPKGNAILVLPDRVEIRGAGIRIKGSARYGAKGLLAVKPRDAFGRTERLELGLEAQGKIELKRVSETGRPERLEVAATGGARVTSGRWSFDAANPKNPVVEGDNLGGPVVRVAVGGKTYEIDPRPLWSESGVQGETGRFRQVPVIDNPALFGGALERTTLAVLQGRDKLLQGSKGELVKRVQHTLNFVLGERLPLSGTMDAATLDALARFKRLSGAGSFRGVDAATMGRLIEWSPPSLTAKSRPKTMVMLWLNSEVPDELKRFKTLAKERGAKPVVIGPADGDAKDVTALATYMAKAERGEIDFDWLVLSGHSGGTSTWGPNGRLDYTTLQEWAKTFPRAAAEIEKLQLLNCYNVTPDRAQTLWKPMFPAVFGAAGFMYSAPGKKAQSSDENLLRTGRLFAQIAKGKLPDKTGATAITEAYARDNYIKEQNASIWVRYRKNDGTEGELFKLTPATEYSMRTAHGADELDIAAFSQRQTFKKYFDAQEAGFENPPAEHHTGALREYLNAVDGVLGRWTQRAQQYQQHRQRQERDSSYVMPEEFRTGTDPDYQVRELQKQRGQVLFLIYYAEVRRFFAERYGQTIVAFNSLLARHHVAERFPAGAELQRMSRKQVLAMLQRIEAAVNQLPDGVAYETIEDPAWRIMTGTDPAQTTPCSPSQFLYRAQAFLKKLDTDFIAAEWL